MPDAVLTAARAYVAAGLSVLPITPGSKRPDARRLPLVCADGDDRAHPSWTPYTSRLATDDELGRWFGGAHPSGVGIIGGAVSGGLVVLDLESADAFQRWRSNAELLLDPALLAALPIVQTGKGFHVYLRTAAPGGNRKLAMQQRQTIAETRGEGGYVLAPPTVHPDTHQPYTLIQGTLTTIPVLDAAQGQAVLDAARALAATDHPASTSAGAGSGESVIDRFNAAHTIESILERHGYRPEGNGRRYIRPGGERSSVLILDGKSLHFNTNDALYAEAPGGTVHAHTPFSAWCLLAHGGAVKRAVKAAAQELGMAQTRPAPPPEAALLEQAARFLGLSSEEGAPEADADPWPYFVHEGGLWMHRTDRDGSPKAPQLLTNFTARIVAETDIDNGDEVEHAYTISATCGRRTRLVEMARKDFESEGALARIVAALGARARVNPQANVRYVMDAIKAMSHAVEERTIHTYTGWCGEGFLFGNGYIDRNGWHPATTSTARRAHLQKRLERYALHPPPEGDIEDALAVFDDLLDLAPSGVMVPLVGAVLLAPVVHLLDAPAPLVHLTAPTGSHKTGLACAVLSLMGSFMPDHPTDTWTSTANSVQKLGWHLKDTVMLLDDYKRANIKAEKVTQLVQNYGDGIGKGRLNSNSELRATYPIRSVIISSGEDQPEGEASTLARILTVDLAKGAVHLGHLTRLQGKDGPYLHLLTIAYLQWLLAQGDLGDEPRTLHQRTRTAVLAKLNDAQHATNPGRVASNVAALFVAWTLCCRFLVAQGHWTQARADAWRQQAKTDLLALAKRQLDLTTGERYSNLFLEAVQGLLVSGKAVLIHADRETPTMEPGQVVIGAHAPDGLYLVVETTYNEVSKATRAAGGTVGYSKKALGQLLHQDGLLLVDEKLPSYTVQKRINGVRVWCWRLHPAVLA